jgi:SSS family solute:Na+ symporter
VRIGVGANGIALLLFAFFPVLLGIVGAVAFPELEHEELALPTVIVNLIPIWLGAILLASLFSAEVSSADAILFMLSTSLSRDLYQTFINPGVTDPKLLRVSRWISVLAGSLGVLLAVILPSVIDALSIFYSLLSVALFVPVIAGLYSSRPGARTCLRGILTAVAATAIFSLSTSGLGVGILTPTALGILVSAIMMGAVFRRP